MKIRIKTQKSKLKNLLRIYIFSPISYALLAIILVGSFLRLQGVFTNSFAFTYDVGRDMLALSNIVHFHRIPLIGATTGLPGIFYGPWWYYFLTPFFILFSGNPQGIALTMSSIGILTIAIGFVLGKRLGGNLLGLILAAVISVSSVMVSLSAQIWNPNISPMFVMLGLLVLEKLHKEVKKDKPKYYLLLGLLLAFVIDLEIVFGLLLALGIIFSVLIINRSRISLKDIVFFAFGGLIILAPRIIFELRHQFLMTKSFLGLLGKTGVHQSGTLLSLLGNRLGALSDQFNGTIGASNEFAGLIILLFIIFSIAVFYKKSAEEIKNLIKTSVTVILIFLLGTVFFSHDIWPHYLVGLPVFYLLLFAIAVYLLAKNVSIKLAVLIALIVFLANLNPYSQIQNLSKPLWEGDASVYRNQVAVIDYVYKQAAGKSFKYVVYTPPVYDYTYQYLFNWYGPKNYHYSPSSQSHLAYFILEPDYQDSARLSNWLKQREADGLIIRSQEVKGGIIVQTRIH
ncbi:MAG TPA: glycosyltransferase family 39 protein [Patescibacteria group bacterium]|jgi:hypothetical protein|nr:glycosyltransferase family 39 protein [Patescibacteria group bacterium]